MMMNKEATKIGFAYVGIVVGAGFSTGQEVMQFFTKYGLWAYLGVIISGFILAFIGRQVAKIGTAFEATNHESTLQYVFGEKFSKVFDYILIFFLFGIAVTMIAGAGAFKGHVSLAEVNQVVPEASIWKGIWFGTIYGGLAFSVGFSTIVAIGGDTEKRTVSGAGAMYGGIIYTVSLALINFALQSEYPTIKNASIPTLTLANNIHPLIATVLSVIMLAVMYNTILGLMYSFAARFTEPYSKNYHIFIIIMMVAGYLLSFVGFAELINKLYTIMGYVGLFIVVAVIIKYFKRKNADKKHIA